MLHSTLLNPGRACVPKREARVLPHKGVQVVEQGPQGMLMLGLQLKGSGCTISYHEDC